MSKKLYKKIALASPILLLSACGTNLSVEDVHESTNIVHTSYQELVTLNHQLLEKELVMNEQFEKVLAEDEELASIADDSADVMTNLNERETIIEEFSTHLDLINDEANKLVEYEGTELSAEEISNLSTELLTFIQDIEKYQESYLNSISVQRDYLDNIASNESNYEDFVNGIETVNDTYLALQEETVTLDQKFVAIDEQVVSLNQKATEASEEELEPLAPVENERTEEDEEEPRTVILSINDQRILTIPNQFPQKFVYDSGVDIEYPEGGVKGVYVTAHSAGGERMDYLTNLMNNTDLNAMVIDVKDDYGNITLELGSENELVSSMTEEMIDAKELIEHLEANNIYPIARIVVFKDSHLAKAHPEWSFTNSDGSIWANNRGESFVNPYLKEVWDYNVEVAIQAAKLGFKDIQFDYVRFPEGFETRDRELNYSHGHYGDDNVDVINMEYRNQAVTDFVAYAKEKLQPYGVDLSVDIFGYAAVVRETPGIGQSFPGIAREVDVISSMIYPSHWGLGNLDIAIPDLDPYNVVNNYAKIELEILDELGDEAPITRPWIQDFTASYLGAGYYKTYGAKEVTEQVKALADNGIHEFLLWNAGNTYSDGATYTFE